MFPGVPVLRTAAITGLGVGRLLPALFDVHAAWSTGGSPPPRSTGSSTGRRGPAPPRASGRLLYATQVATSPPRFVVFGMDDPGPSYQRYLEHRLRDEFGFAGVPIRMSFRPRHRKPPRPRRVKEAAAEGDG